MERKGDAQTKPIAVGMSEAARLSGLSRRTLENYLAAKVLESLKVGRRRLIKIRDLERFLSSDRPSAR